MEDIHSIEKSIKILKLSDPQHHKDVKKLK